MSEDSGSGPCFSRNTRLIRAAYVRGKAGVGGSLSAFLLDYSWTELWENTLQHKPSQEFCFVLIHFLSFPCAFLSLFALCIVKLLEKGAVDLHEPETKAYSMAASSLWTWGHNVPSYKPVPLSSHYCASICPFTNQNVGSATWDETEWAKEAFPHL